MTADVNNHKISENILDPGGQIIASQRFDAVGAGPGWYFYNYDIRQSTTAIIDHTGKKVTGYQYDSFGNTTLSGNTNFINETQFTGAISDTSTGLYYMNARYYNTNTGRFLSQDSYKGSAYQPWTQHLYTYCCNNPVNLIDPTGHLPKWLNRGTILTAIGVAAAVVAAGALIAVTAGAATPAVMAVAATIGSYSTAVTITTVGLSTVAAAGIATATMGVFDMVEGVTGENKLKEKVFKGNDYIYYGVEETLSLLSFMGATYFAPDASIGYDILRKNKVVSNYGNVYDIKKAKTHKETFKASNKGEANSSVDIMGKKTGDLLIRRWYDQNEKMIRDIHFTNHGNPKTHPEVPHLHEWK
jgi:RHS repeat-associated protein